MNLVLWVLAAVLAAAFAGAGLLKVTQPEERLHQSLPYTVDYPLGTIRFIGTMELLGALGLILPAAAEVAVVLTPLAATGIGVIMVLAMRVHARRREVQGVVFTAVLLALAAVVAWGRFGPYPF